MSLTAHLKNHKEAYVKAVELTVLVTGVVFGLTGLNENTKSNLTASRSQLYESEAVISGREHDRADSSLLSLYAHPDESVTDPREYALVRMKAMSDDAGVLQARNVAELYEAFGGLKAYGPGAAPPGIVGVRQASIHLSAIFGVMHSALDYQREGVMSSEELGTWFGYVSDIGPHPLLLTTIWNWHDARYMTREFAASVRQRLLDDSPRNRTIIEYYYPQMLAPEFLDTLAAY